MGWLDLTQKEYQDYDAFVKTHSCVSNREISIIPDSISKTVKVRCLNCNVQIDITDWDSA